MKTNTSFYIKKKKKKKKIQTISKILHIMIILKILNSKIVYIMFTLKISNR